MSYPPFQALHDSLFQSFQPFLVLNQKNPRNCASPLRRSGLVINDQVVQDESCVISVLSTASRDEYESRPRFQCVDKTVCNLSRSRPQHEAPKMGWSDLVSAGVEHMFQHGGVTRTHWIALLVHS
jgi:hypothetical protein